MRMTAVVVDSHAAKAVETTGAELRRLVGMKIDRAVLQQDGEVGYLLEVCDDHRCCLVLETRRGARSHHCCLARVVWQGQVSAALEDLDPLATMNSQSWLTEQLRPVMHQLVMRRRLGERQDCSQVY